MVCIERFKMLVRLLHEIKSNAIFGEALIDYDIDEGKVYFVQECGFDIAENSMPQFKKAISLCESVEIIGNGMIFRL